MDEVFLNIDWHAPISAELPAGPDVEFDDDFAELEAAAAATPEQQYGSTIIPAKEPDWQRVLQLSAALSQRTRDLRVVLFLTRALTKLHGLSGLARGLGAAEILLSQHWGHVHPHVTIDGQEDPQVRHSVLSEFGAPLGLAHDMRQSSVLQSELGPILFWELDRIIEQGSVDINGFAMSRVQVDGIVRDTAQGDHAATLEVPGAILEIIQTIQARATEGLGNAYAPDLSALQGPLQRVAALLRPQLHPAGSVSTNQVHSRFAASHISPSHNGEIRSRGDVLRVLDAACRYLEENEPTNPAPLLMRRAQKLMTMSFVDIVKHMAPDGLAQARFVIGAEEESSDQ